MPPAASSHGPDEVYTSTMLFEKWTNKIVVLDGVRGNAPWYQQQQQQQHSMPILNLTETKVFDGEENEEKVGWGYRCRARWGVEQVRHDHRRWEMFAGMMVMMAITNQSNIRARTVVRRISFRQCAPFSFSRCLNLTALVHLKPHTITHHSAKKTGMAMQASSNALLHDVIKAHKLKKPIMVKIFGQSQCEEKQAGKI